MTEGLAVVVGRRLLDRAPEDRARKDLADQVEGLIPYGMGLGLLGILERVKRRDERRLDVPPAVHSGPSSQAPCLDGSTGVRGSRARGDPSAALVNGLVDAGSLREDASRYAERGTSRPDRDR